MANNSKIEWTDASWNPVVGCSKVSEGCRHCYAMGVAHRNAAMGIEQYKGLTVKKVSGVEWNGKVRLVSDALDKPLHWKQSKMIFVNSMSDLFHKDVPFEFIDKVFLVMASCPQHIFQILTKRADRLLEYYSEHNVKKYSLPNVWIGVSVEDQNTAHERIPKLLQIPAVVHWISAEPLLGNIDFEKYLYPKKNGNMIRWVVVGGESGMKARPMHPDWVRSIRDVCADAGVSFFFKQWGQWCPVYGHIESCETTYLFGEAQNGEELTAPLGMDNNSSKNHYWDDNVFAVKIGKKKSGRLLDGREWNEYPFGTSADIRTLRDEIQKSYVEK